MHIKYPNVTDNLIQGRFCSGYSMFRAYVTIMTYLHLGAENPGLPLTLSKFHQYLNVVYFSSVHHKVPKIVDELCEFIFVIENKS